MKDRIVFALNTACRLGELQDLRNDWIDWEHHHIHLPGAHTKNKCSRSIPFSPDGAVAELLKRRKALGATAYVFSTDGLKSREFRAAWESVVLRASGQVPSYDTKGGLDQTSRARFKAVGLRWHDLRHESASRWYEWTRDLLWVSQQLLDHSSLK